ncbi:MAG TPA: SDR family NAD(P)-dependent oxidoreductase [Candidatus Dormibacteraeota bacterium]|nr:SDR family NAD(P)-dependent oxidoreductase [Candidatus Dormibacteraeota bacterium]
MPGLNPVVVITGATGAIGAATAALLARRGARLLLLARPSARLDALVERLDRDNRVSSVEVDLASLASVRSAARQISRTVAHVDALVNAAAMFTSEYQLTKEGFELMLATNHLGPFLLTNMLRDRLAGAGRVITVTAPASTRVDIDHLLAKDQFRPLRTFGATKAAALMFTFELARRAKRWDVGAYAFHPGLVRSELMREAARPIRLLTRLVSRSPDRAAEDVADLATSPAFASTTGWFFKGGRRIEAPKATLDPEAQRNLWKRSAELVELGEEGF